MYLYSESELEIRPFQFSDANADRFPDDEITRENNRSISS